MAYRGFYIRGIERAGTAGNQTHQTALWVPIKMENPPPIPPAYCLPQPGTRPWYMSWEGSWDAIPGPGACMYCWRPALTFFGHPWAAGTSNTLRKIPLLNARMAVAYVKGLQDEKVVATVKHYAANNQEWDRHNVSSDIDERTLHEIYLPAFKAAVQEAKAGSIMNSYNLINGIHASQHDELNNKILRDKWGFDGFVMSDWSSTYDAVGAANGGLDLEMPRARFMTSEKLIPAIRQGLVKESTIDDKVKRMLRIIFRFGFFDTVQLDKNIPLDNPEAAKVALELARRGIVLLKNKGNVLPLNASKIKSLAVIGPNANAYISGGGSSYTFPFHSSFHFTGYSAIREKCKYSLCARASYPARPGGAICFLYRAWKYSERIESRIFQQYQTERCSCKDHC